MKKMKKIVEKIMDYVVALLLSFSLLMVCGCGENENKKDGPVMNIDMAEDGSFIYDGDEQYFYEVKEGEKAVVHFNVTVTDGSVSFTVHEKDNESNYEYRGTITETCEFDVLIDEVNEYRIYVEAEQLHGKYGISWRTE